MDDVLGLTRPAELAEDFPAPISLFCNQADIFIARVLAVELAGQLLGDQVDGCERRAKLVRGHRRHGAERRQALLTGHDDGRCIKRADQAGFVLAEP